MLEVLKGRDGHAHPISLESKFTQPSNRCVKDNKQIRIKKIFLNKLGLGWMSVFKSTKIDCDKKSQYPFPKTRINFKIRKTTLMYSNDRMVGNLISTKYQSNWYRSE